MQIGNAGALEALVLDTAGRWINRDYGRRVASHEAGHFLIAYLMGILPRVYTLSTLDAFRKYAEHFGNLPGCLPLFPEGLTTIR